MLNISSEKDGTKLTVKLEGRIDTKTSNELDENLKNLIQGVDEVVLDVAGIEYISSAGLRVILSTQKALGKKDALQVIHPSDVVLDIFDITGFGQVVKVIQ